MKQRNSYHKLNARKKQGLWAKIFNSFSNNSNNLLEVLEKAINAAASYTRIAPFDTPIFTDWTAEAAIQDGLKVSNWVYAAVKRLSDAAQSVPWVVQEKRSGKWVTVEDHPLAALINMPNRFTTRQDMIERITQHLNLAGNAILHKIRGRAGIVVELESINPDSIKPVPNQREFISHYEFFRQGKKDCDVPTEDIVHMMFSDPANPFWGMAPLQAVGKIVDTEVNAIRWWKVSLQNRAVKDGVLSFKRPLTIDQWSQARAQVADQISGYGNARGPLVIGEDVEYIPFAMTPAELDFVNSRKMTSVDILAVFCVPPPLVGLLENANYANTQEARKIFWIDTIMPYMESLRATLNASLVPDFGDPTKLRLWLDFSKVDIFMDIFAERAAAAERYFRMGVPMDVITEALNLQIPPTATGDISFVPSNMIPYGSSREEAAELLDQLSPAIPGTSTTSGVDIPEVTAGLPEVTLKIDVKGNGTMRKTQLPEMKIFDNDTG